MNRSVTRQGLRVTVKEVSRGPRSARVAYTIDAPITVAGSPDGALRNGSGRELPQLSGSTGICGTPLGHGAGMRCDETALIVSPPVGTLVRLVVTARSAPGRGVLSRPSVAVPFRMP